MSVAAFFYDGRSTQQHRVELALQDAVLHIRGEGIERRWPLADVRISSRVGNTPARLVFPDGGQCETVDHEGLERMLQAGGRPARLSVHRIERRIAYVVIALVVTAILVWAGIAIGLPALAKEVAFSLPPSAEQVIGGDALRTLDQTMLKPSALPPGRQRELHALFARIAAQAPAGAGYRLELRAGGNIGANALALPAGIVVLTDELVALAKNDGELEAVLAHEVGHMSERHALRSLLQASAAALAIAVAVGDVTSLTSLAAALPTVLLQAKYSRQFELEADDYALAHLSRNGIGGERLASMLERMEAARASMPAALSYLSTHPATAERVARAREAR